MLNFIPKAMTNARVWEVIDEFGDASQPAPANKATEAALDAVLKLG